MHKKTYKLALILNIETSTKNCSVSIAKNGKTLAIKELNDGKYSHSEKLTSFVEDVIQSAEIKFSDLNAIAISKGPGSYTGLRIGVSTAKGLCFALDIPLISVNTLKSLSASISVKNGCVIPLLDARRMEVYSSVFDTRNNVVRGTKAEIITENSFSNYLKNGEVVFLGDGAEKCKKIIVHNNATFIDDRFPSAKEMEKLSFEKYKINDFEDVAYFEPYYLKDFFVTKPKS